MSDEQALPAAEVKKKIRHEDPEIGAMKKISSILDELSVPATRRVLTWLSHRAYDQAAGKLDAASVEMGNKQAVALKAANEYPETGITSERY